MNFSHIFFLVSGFYATYLNYLQTYRSCTEKLLICFDTLLPIYDTKNADTQPGELTDQHISWPFI